VRTLARSCPRAPVPVAPSRIGHMKGGRGRQESLLAARHFAVRDFRGQALLPQRFPVPFSGKQAEGKNRVRA
jgi:hypothetical protein